MLVVDLLHEFELGVWKACFTHLLRILYAQGNDAIQALNRRQVHSRWLIIHAVHMLKWDTGIARSRPSEAALSDRSGITSPE
jgi:hypothetical protein